MLRVGDFALLTGNVTTLNWIGPRPAADVERNLGYGAGRLSQGYLVVLLKQMWTPEDFEFEGTTLRSGGRLGLPAHTTAADALRPRVHDRIQAERGPLGYQELQQHALRSAMITGPQRIAKVIPTTRHDVDMPPAEQYPMGGGGLQWTIKKSRPCRFLVALHVDPARNATTPTFTVSITDAPHDYPNRARIARYLEQA